MNITYLAIDLKRQLRNVLTIIFAIGLPVALYLVFGSTFGAGGERAGAGNVKFYVMLSMAAYGATVATTSLTSQAAIELMQGWGRQLGLTPMRSSSYVATKVVVALVIAAASVVVLFGVGAANGAEADDWWMWPATGALAWILSTQFALYGLAIAQLFRAEGAIGIGSASLVLLAFFGNLFVPLGGVMLSIAKFTPMYGLAGLSRWPFLEGQIADTGDGVSPGTDSLGLLILNWVAWTAIFGLICVWAVRRGRQRQ
jgi:ABC-2 type transport system permease protein